MQDVILYLVGLPLACIDLDQQKSQLAGRAWVVYDCNRKNLLRTHPKKAVGKLCERQLQREMWVKSYGMRHES